MENKKILLVANIYRHFTAFHMPWIKYLQEKGYVVWIAASDVSGGKKDLETQGINCVDISFSRKLISLNTFKSIFELKKLMKQYSFLLIHVHTPIASFLTRYVAHRCNQQKILYTAHGFHFSLKTSWKSIPFFWAEKIAVSWTDGIIVINEEDREIANKLGYVENKNLFFTHGVGVNLSEHQTMENKTVRNNVFDELNISSDSHVLLAVGDLNLNKNQMMLLEAMGEIIDGKRKVHLLIAGEGDMLRQLTKRAEALQISDYVHFLGFRKDIPMLMLASDLLVHASRREGLPRCIMEAMASGLPVVATDVRGSSDLVSDGENGFLVRLGDIAGMASAVISILENSGLRKAFSSEARKKIENYSDDIVKQELISIYKRFLTI